MRYVLICGLVSGVALVSWLLAGRRLVTVLDRVTLLVVERPVVDRVIYESGTLELGGKRLDLMNPAFTRMAEVFLDSSGRAILESGGRQLPLGPGRAVPYIGGLTKFEFTQEAGDQVLLTVEHSRLAWPTPLEMNFMTGYAPSRRRNVYVRLRWTKLSGSKLHILWKTGQAYYGRDGWSPPRIESVTDGLIQLQIQESESAKSQRPKN